MSQWTHVLGVIRYDSMNKNCWPEPPDKDDRVIAELQFISATYQTGIPYGSEGGMDVKFHTTGRGPTVLITGDLRDFGKSDLPKISDWMNDRHLAVENQFEQYGLMLRDAFINCRVEFDDQKYIVEPDDNYKFVLNTYDRIRT